MTVELEKALALKEHLDEPYFIVCNDEDHDLDVAYEGSEIDIRKQYDSYIEPYDPEHGSQGEDPLLFEEWCKQELTQVEEYDESNNNDYLVLTDEEADIALDESLDNYLEECIKPDLEKWVWKYFDTDRWKEDAKSDSRGHSLSPYDGDEIEITINNTNYYLYRMN
jgi:hypothetical protein